MRTIGRILYWIGLVPWGAATLAFVALLAVVMIVTAPVLLAGWWLAEGRICSRAS
jgi:hypothetical protein